MDIDPDDIFRDDDDPENEFYQERDATKEMLVYLVDASPKMFSTTCLSKNEKDVSHFEVALSTILPSLKTQIINRSYDEVAICFFNTREKKNLQDLNGVYVFNVPEREDLDRPTARLIKEFDCVQESFSKQIGSKYGILPGTRDNSLYNALWAAQALLRKGSAKTADKRILLFTNEDDPFGNIKGVTKMDMMRTTIQRAKDAQDLGISIELLPLSRPDDDFNVSTFYADLLGLEGNDLAEVKALAAERFEDMKDQLRKRMFRKRKVRRINFIIANGISIELNTYAVVRPTNPGAITWLDSVTNLPIKAERSFFCSDTGALLQEPPKLFQIYKNENIMFTADELSEIKRVSTGHLHLLGFKPLSCLKDYHNLRPSTFVVPSDEEVVGSTCVFIALHRSMLRLKRFAVAFYGSSTHPQLVALVAQDEIICTRGQVEPPGMHMIYLPYSDDIRHIEELHTDTTPLAPRATEDQIMSAYSLIKRIDLKKFSVCQFANPALQRHYAVLQALALDEDEMPDVKDETLPDEEGFARPGVVKALEELKLCVYGENFEQENDAAGSGKTSEASKKRKAISDNATKEYAKHEWSDLADNGQLKELTVSELKYYLTVHNLPVTGKKEALISRILTHMGK
ncbi:ATP-dependent DNA helicase 2 subunit Ku70-like protein [Perilla frutescens var. hirtella]|uniref:ATP-dependent DNA helicase 2 subunit KU70 n=1 Tax=Perilla frutescens var. hirtella TaxID=608512 RepID=A0AAD4JJ54_PERFH|nr:ATP-dependent DNA helicase 2 subunit Ku70-like protein [Perilla frutescens var. hirtella]